MSLPIKERQITMFREKFHQFLDPEHELMRAGRMIPWDTIHDELSCYYSKRGRRPKFIRPTTTWCAPIEVLPNESVEMTRIDGLTEHPRWLLAWPIIYGVPRTHVL